MTAQRTFEKLRKAFGAAELEHPAIDAVQQWLYTPSLKGGEVTEINVLIAIRSVKGALMTLVEPDLPFLAPRPTSATGETEEIFKIEPGRVSAPRAIYSPAPEYSEIARFVQFQGTVGLGAVVGSDGATRYVWVEKKLGLGLDQKAVESVSKWRYQPAMKDGQPVAVAVHIEVSFHLY